MAIVQMSKFAPARVSREQATRVVAILQPLLCAEIELSLTLKQAHWNVIGPAFIGVHSMLDDGAAMARDLADSTAERIATLGAAPYGTPGAIVATRRHADYSLGKADTQTHLTAIDRVISDVDSEIREAIATTGSLDQVSQNMLFGHAERLEKFQWFVRAHLEIGDGMLPGAN